MKFDTAGSYKDLYIWAFLALAFGLTFIIGDIISNKKQNAAKKTLIITT